MPIAYQLLLLVHLVGFAGLLGGCLAQLGDARPEVNLAMLWGAWLSVVTGIGLYVITELGPDPVAYAPLAVKLGLGLVALVLVAVNRKFAEIPRGLLGLMATLAVAEGAVALLWP